MLLPAGLTDWSGWLRRLLSEWALAEVAPGRLLPWLPVAFGFGIVGYFTAEREPAAWAAADLALAGIVVAFMARRRAIGFPLALAFAAIAAGFAVATLRTARIAHPVLQQPISSVQVAGFVEIREERARSDRVVIAVHRFEGRRGVEAPDRIRVAVRTALGRDPQAEKEAAKAKAAVTIGPLVEKYLALKRGKVRKNTYVADYRYLTAYWKPLRSLPVEAVTRRIVAARLNDINTERGAISRAWRTSRTRLLRTARRLSSARAIAGFRIHGGRVARWRRHKARQSRIYRARSARRGFLPLSRRRG